MPHSSAPTGPERPAAALAGTLALGLPALLALHALSFGRVPAGLEGGPAVEALRGVHLIVRRRFEVMSFAIGPSAETLWLYVMGACVELVGPRWISVVLPSILASAAVVALTVLAARRLDPATPPAIPFLLSAGSVWLFHYGEVGLRTIAAPLFFLVALLLVHAGASAGTGRRVRFAAGFVLGLSVYAYSSCRVLAPAWLLFALAGELRKPRAERSFPSVLGPTLLGIAVASIPNFLFFLREPSEFLFRGYYVYRGGWVWKVVNVFWTVLLPFHLPRFYSAWLGPGHNFDATAVSLTGAGVHPVDPVTAVAFACGLALASRTPRPPGLSYLLWVLGTGTLLLGVSGPSLTRLLLLQPAIVLLASLALGRAWRRWPRARLVLAAALLVPGALGFFEYAFRFGRSADAQSEYLVPANAMGARARDLLDRDPALRVLIVTRKGRDIVKFYNYRHIERVWLVEGAPPLPGAPPAPGAVADALRRFSPGVVLVERGDAFREAAATLGASGGDGPVSRGPPSAAGRGGASPRAREHPAPLERDSSLTERLAEARARERKQHDSEAAGVQEERDARADPQAADARVAALPLEHDVLRDHVEELREPDPDRPAHDRERDLEEMQEKEPDDAGPDRVLRRHRARERLGRARQRGRRRRRFGDGRRGHVAHGGVTSGRYAASTPALRASRRAAAPSR